MPEYPGVKVGAAAVVITPPLGVSLAGSYTDRRADGIHDDLFARAMVIDDGNTAIAIASVDVIGVRASTTAAARRLIEQRCGIPGDHVLIAATHNHSGPLTRDLRVGGLAGETDEVYLGLMERQIAAAVELANRRRLPARLRLACSTVEGVAFNRRFFMQQGPARTNPGKQNPAIVGPAGPVDQRIWTLTALACVEGVAEHGPEGVPPYVVPLGVLVNFGLHPAIVAGTVIGGDFPHFLEAGVQRLLGPPGNGAASPARADQGAGPGCVPVVLFANAPCADINHVDVTHGQRQGGFAEAARVGTILAAEVMKSACRLTSDWESAAGTPVRLRGARRSVDVPLRRPSAAELAWARDAAKGRMSMTPGDGLEVVEAQRILALTEHWADDIHTTEVQALAVGDDLAVVGLPGEIFAELGLQLRARSPFTHTLVLGLANEAIGYVPSHRAYDEGGYEAAASRLQPGGGEKLLEDALQLLATLHSA